MDESITYTKKLGIIGDRISIISKKFINQHLNEVNINNLKNRYNSYLSAIKEYKECKISLTNIVPPSKVKIEHEKMVEAIQLFVEGTEVMFNSINIEKGIVDKKNIDKWILIQKMAEKAVIELSDEIVLKLIG